jgi:hypothetical protein
MTDMTLPGDRLAAVCPKCGFRCSAGGKFHANTIACPTVGCVGKLQLDTLACTLLVAESCWPHEVWANMLTCAVSQHRSFNPKLFADVRTAEDIAIERGLERLYGRFLHEELEQSPDGHAGVTWARAPLDARVRALARAFLERGAQILEGLQA